MCVSRTGWDEHTHFPQLPLYDNDDDFACVCVAAFISLNDRPCISFGPLLMALYRHHQNLIQSTAQ